MTRLNDPTTREMDHEIHRICTMGDRISQRLKTIKKAKKMFAFAKALTQVGEMKLAGKAWKKLREMGFTHTGRPVRSRA